MTTTKAALSSGFLVGLRTSPLCTSVPRLALRRLDLQTYFLVAINEAAWLLGVGTPIRTFRMIVRRLRAKWLAELKDRS